MLVILSGTSGVGKTVLSRELVEKFGCRFVPTWTTRALRFRETEKFSLMPNEFAQRERDCFFFVVDNFYGNRYGLSRGVIEQAATDEHFWLLDRPLWALQPFGPICYAHVIVLPQNEQQLVAQIRQSGRQERMAEVIDDYHKNYLPHQSQLSAWPQPSVSPLVVMNRQGFVSQTAATIFSWISGGSATQNQQGGGQ